MTEMETTKTKALPEQNTLQHVGKPPQPVTDRRRRVVGPQTSDGRSWRRLQRDAGNKAIARLFIPEQQPNGSGAPANEQTLPAEDVSRPIAPPVSELSEVANRSAPEPDARTQSTALEREQTAPAKETTGAGAETTGVVSAVPASGETPLAAGGPAQSVAIDTSSAEGLLQSLATVAPSALGEAVTVARDASIQIQMQEKRDLQAAFPRIERPTGLPRQSERPSPESPDLKRGEAPAGETPDSRQGEAPETRQEVAAGPIPGAQLSTAAVEPAGEDEGSWWDWLVNRVRNFLSQLPTSDAGVSTSAGLRPQVDLTGDADPSQNLRQQQTSDAEVASQRAMADRASMAYFGENDIYPTVPAETLQPSYQPTPPPVNAGRGLPLMGASANVRSLFDQGAGPWFRVQVHEQVEQRRQHRIAYEQHTAEIRDSGDRQIADETERVREEQINIQTQARGDVAARRADWQVENLQIQETYAAQSMEKRQEIDAQIEEKVQTAETTADTTLTEAEGQAEQERIAAEAKAAEKKREAENRPRSWWDRVKGAVSDAFAAIKQAINDIFDALRDLVRQIIETAKTVVRGIIETARLAVVGLIRGFGELLKGLVTVALLAFPDMAAGAREWIDSRVNTAVDVVNAAAQTLKEAADTILDWVGEGLDMALAGLQAAFNLALDVLEFLTLGLFELMELLQKLVELLANIGPMMQTIWDLIQNPEPAIEAIKQFLGGLIAQVPAQAMALARGAITFSDPPPNHWQGIWEHLQPKLEYLAANWWEVIKQTGWFLIWPFDEDSPIWQEVPELWNSIGEAFQAVWNGDFNRALDKYLRAQQLVVNIVNLFYGWVFLGLVIGYGIAGGIVGVEVGVIPGVIAGMGVGAGIAAEIGVGLLAATAVAEGAIMAKAGFDLIFASQTPQENDDDYEAVASSGLVLAILGALVLLGSLAARFGKAIVSRAGRIIGAAVRAVLGPRAVEWLEAAFNRIRLKIAEVQARLRGEGRFKFKNSPVTEASYEGPARNLHPERFNEIIAELDRNGVEINVRDAGDPWTGSYQPGRPGEPGQMNVHREVDLRTLEHEYQHFLDDRAGGYPGLRHYLENPEVMWEMERAAYDREIELVNADGALSAEDKAAIIRELEAAKARERAYYLGSEE